MKFARASHAVKFLSVTNGQSGHQHNFGEDLVKIRRNEARTAAERLGIAESQVLDSADGALQPDLVTRGEIIRQIRGWGADVVLTHRACDYHPDHRYTSQIVQDAAYLVMVPAICPDSAPLKTNPVFLYFEDNFRVPNPFRPDVAVLIDDVWCEKVYAMDAHASQFYEWLPWIDGETQDVPRDAEMRRHWLSAKWTRPVSSTVRNALENRYRRSVPCAVHAEAFEICEYGRQPSLPEVDELFPW